jgi:hypothetical protein
LHALCIVPSVCVYVGQVASHAQDHQFNVNADWKF